MRPDPAATAAAVAAAAALLLARPPGSLLAIRLGCANTDSSLPHEPTRRRWVWPSVATVAALAGMAGWLGLGLHLVGLAGVVAAVGSACLLGLRRARHDTRVAARQSAVIAWCDALSAELLAGAPPAAAVRVACRHERELADALRACELGLDVPTALRRSAREPGFEALRAVAASWQVAAESGAALADVVDRLAVALRADDEIRAEVRAGLGPARATARLLAVLPAFGVLLGTSMDADPIGFLLGTSWGLGCLAVGVSLCIGGVTWVDRLASAAVR